MIQESKKIVRLAASETDTAAVVPVRVAALPGADRRIQRKRLARPAKFVEERAQGNRKAVG